MRPASIWTRWLTAASMGVALFGLSLVLAPALALQGFSFLVYGDPSRLQAMGGEAARYISLAHAVLGAVMFGWGLMLVAVVQRLLAQGSKLGWQLVAGSLAVWFVPDTAYSLISGYWQNAVLNIGFALLFAMPLAATRKPCLRA
jgi:hypothetical protein